MDNTHESESPPTTDFRLAEWLVQPRQNRLSQGEEVIQVEPKLMDVLVFLAHRGGEVVSKRQITDAVWPDVFITESVITRSIAGLRRALGDDARNPRYIETISKRGYRMIAEVAAAPTTAQHHLPPEDLHIPPPPRFTKAPVPFVVGQWVRGRNFYGRTAEIAEILEGNRNWLWLLGTRRIGKTSLLKQLEHLTATSPELGFFPIFWDLQGADTLEDLHLDFGDAVLDTEERLRGVGIGPSEVQADDLFDSLGRLRRKLKPKKLKLLLLCDEVEELIHLNQKDPALLRKLRRAMHSREGIRSVLASSSRLWRLAEAEGDTSPFLDGFTPPHYIGPLCDDEARELIRQSRLPAESRPAFTEEVVERIREQCGNHPYLIHLLCRRTLEQEDVDEAIAEVAADRAVSFFFAVDFDLLNETQRAILRLLAQLELASASSIREDLPDPAETITGNLKTLFDFGLVQTNQAGELLLKNSFLRSWLLETQSEK